MTPKMIQALADAEDAFNHRGLEYTVAGFKSTRPSAYSLGYHSFSTINALVNRGHLQRGGKGKSTVVHITAAGETALATWRERNAARAAKVRR